MTEIRKTVYSDLDKGITEILKNTVAYLTRNNLEVADVTLRALKERI